MVDVDSLHNNFVMLGHQWRVDGELVRPSRKQLKETIDKLVQDLYDQPDLSQAQVGHLLVQKDAGQYEVYLHLGSTE